MALQQTRCTASSQFSLMGGSLAAMYTIHPSLTERIAQFVVFCSLVPYDYRQPADWEWQMRPLCLQQRDAAMVEIDLQMK